MVSRTAQICDFMGPSNEAFPAEKIIELERRLAWPSDPALALVETIGLNKTSESRKDAIRATIETMQDVVFETDERGMFVYLNEAVRDLGYSKNELLGMDLSVLMSAEDLEMYQARISEEPVEGFRVRLQKKLQEGCAPQFLVMELNARSWEGIDHAGVFGTLRNISEKLDLLAARTRLESLHSYFAGEDIMNLASADTGMMNENVEASILFLDVRNFTGISEKLQPQQVAVLLNRIYNDLMDLIISRGGAINKFMGDAILATFGCPKTTGQDAMNAVESAMAIRQTMEFINRTRPDFVKNDLQVGIGIATGKVFAGNIGSFRRREYTVIGDVVNIASRLQTATRRLPGSDILVDQATMDKLGDQFQTKEVRMGSLKGKTETVRIYSIQDYKREMENGVTLF